MTRRTMVNIIGIIVLIAIMVVSAVKFTNSYNYVEPDVVYEFTNKYIEWD